MTTRSKVLCPHCGGHPLAVDGVVVPHASPPDGTVPWSPCAGSRMAIGQGGLL